MCGFLSVWRFLLFFAHGPLLFTRCMVSCHLVRAPLSLLISSYLPVLTLTALKKVWKEKDEYRASNSQLKYLVNDLKVSGLASSGCVLIHAGCYKKYHRLVGLNNRPLFSEFLRLGSPRSTSNRVWLLVRALFLICTGATFSLCPHMVFPWCVFMEREADLSFFSSTYKATNPTGSKPHPYDLI